MKMLPRSTYATAMTLCATALLWSAAQSWSQSPGVWSGQVVDIRTNEPLKGFTLRAGLYGRIDPFPDYKSQSDDNGNFSIVWPADAWDMWDASSIKSGHFLRIHNGNGNFLRNGSYYDDDYLQLAYVRLQPQEDILIRAIPRSCYIKGRAFDSETGKPLVDVNIAVMRVGAVLRTTRTDTKGEFTFDDPFRAFTEDAGLAHPLWVHDIVPFSITEHWTGLPTGIPPLNCNNLSIRVYDSNYEDISPPVVDGQWSKSLPLLSSRTDAIHTYCTLLAPKAGRPLPQNPIHAQILQGSDAKPNKIQQSIEFKTTAKRKFAKNKVFILESTATSGLTVTFKSSKPRVVSIKGKRATMRSKGTVVISARQPGNVTWKAAKVVKRQVTLH